MTTVARIRKDGVEQPLGSHLRAVAAYCGRAAEAAGLRRCGTVTGLLHDLGKYSQSFQDYIRSKYDEADQLDEPSSGSKKRVNHSAAGAQFLRELHDSRLTPGLSLIVSAILSHHNPAGLVDFLSADGEHQPYAERLTRGYEYTYFDEVHGCLRLHKKHLERLHQELEVVRKKCNGDILQFLLLGKFLYSCLIDADRTNSADFEYPGNRELRHPQYRAIDWRKLHERFEDEYFSKFSIGSTTSINTVRRAIADACLARAGCPNGVYRLSVPTGSGKTLASLRFALAHAANRQNITTPVSRIIYVLPFTTILRQNADEARAFVGDENVLEHHSNLLPSEVSRKQLVLSENWDAPIVFTTTVQFLNAFYSSSREAQRRLHQAAGAVLIFDEAQALPIKTLHLFNHALNFLTKQTFATALICTATQPLLDKIDSQYGALSFSGDADFAADIDLSPLATRTRLVDRRKKEFPWSCAILAEALQEPLAKKQNVLVIVNTTDQAAELFRHCKAGYKELSADIVHLSNKMCPAHIRDTLDKFYLASRRKGERPPLLCISTSLVEAGVDIDFDLVVRDLAGIVSVIQAAGRCNRHNDRALSDVWLINLECDKEHPGLREEVEAAERVLRDMELGKEGATLTLDHVTVARATELYYEYFYYVHKYKMLYPIEEPIKKQIKTNMLDWLTCNKEAFEYFKQQGHCLSKETKEAGLCAAPESAAQKFKVIDNPTHSVIVPYGEDGQAAISALCAAFRDANGLMAGAGKLIVNARPYTVNLYKTIFDKLRDIRAICEVQENTGIFHLRNAGYYDNETGVSCTPGRQPFLGS